MRLSFAAIPLTMACTAFAQAAGPLAAAERLLAAGHAVEAAQQFERAARHGEEHHSSDEAAGEVGLVRAHWQAGEVRKALAYAHLVSGEHAESAEALAWLALIEDRVGQADAAMARLTRALERTPLDARLLFARASLLVDRGAIGEAAALVESAPAATTWSADERAWLRTRVALASVPAAAASAPAVPARCEATAQASRPVWFAGHAQSPRAPLADDSASRMGLVFDAGRRLLVPWQGGQRAEGRFAVQGADGRLRQAVVESIHADAEVVVMRLIRSIDAPAEPVAIGRFVPGRQAFMLVPVSGGPMSAAVRPRLVAGLLTSGADATQARFSSRQVLVGHSALVFDSAGRLVAHGMSAQGSDARLRVSAAVGQAALARDGDPAGKPARGLSAEELYERLLPNIVQVQACMP